MRKRSDGRFVSVDRPVLFIAGALLFAFTFALAVWRRYPAHGLDAVTIALAAAVLACIVLAFALPTTQFTFDPARKLITWSSQSFFKGDSGQLEFSDVRAVDVQSTSGSDGILTYRVALRTDDRTLPLAVEYVGARTAAEAKAAQIRQILGLNAPAA